MLSMFLKKKKLLGLDIGEDYVRYVEVLKNKKEVKVVSHGEERVANVEPRNSLMAVLSSIKRKTKNREAIVSLPDEVARFETVKISKNVFYSDLLEKITFALTEENLFSHDEAVLFFEKLETIDKDVFFKVMICSKVNAAFFQSVFKNSGIKVARFKSRKDALVSSCVKEGMLLPVMVLNMEEQFTDFAIHFPFNSVQEKTLRISKERLPEEINESYADFYKKNEEKIGYVFASGFWAEDVNFLNNLSRQTRLAIEEADVFINFEFKKDEIPPISRKESLSFAVALGLVLD